VRALVVGALGLSLIGCSHPLPPQAALVSCTGAGDPTCAAARPPQPMWLKAPYAAADTKPARAAASSADARARPAHRLSANSEKLAIPATQAASSRDVPLPASAPRRPAISAAMAKADAADAPEPKPAPEPQPLAVATAAAEPLVLPAVSQPKAPASERAKERADHTAPARNEAAKATPAPSDNLDLLVAVVMARPDTKSVSDLAGKTIAIDDRYAKSSGTVRTAIVAAGATEVQLSEGSTTAINRLTNGEVPAAVVALVAPDAAETFPDIKGFTIFHVPLSPRTAKARER
jgi:hypothetical protein